MNTADIDAARRLIAQFEGNALGRHNSNQWNRGDWVPREYVPEQRHHIALKDGPQECAVGEYCWKIEGSENYPNRPIVMVIKTLLNSLRDFGYAIADHDRPYMEFEKVWLVVQDQRRTQRLACWHRIA